MKKIVKIVLLLSILLLVSNITTNSKEWLFVTLSADAGFSLYIDKDSMIFSGNKAWYWSKFEFIEPQESVKKGEFYSILHLFIEIDCVKKTFTNPYAMQIKKNREVIWKGHIPAKPVSILSDSIMEREYELVCIKLKPK
jgi:hypothetical protein